MKNWIYFLEMSLNFASKEGTNPIYQLSIIDDNNYCIPANRPDIIGIVPIFQFQNLKKSGHSDFQKEKNTFSFVKMWNWVVKDWS